MTARDVLTRKYLGSDYQHKKHLQKKKPTRNKHAEKIMITKLTGLFHDNIGAKKKSLEYFVWGGKGGVRRGSI